MSASHSTSMAGQIVVISGAGRGLGREYALFLASIGATIVVNDLTGAPEVADEIAARGGRASPYEADVATWPGARALIDYAISAYGRLDVLINNAGYLRPIPTIEMTEEDWDEMLSANLMTTIAPIHAAIKHWQAAKSAGRHARYSIINTTSEIALAAYPGRSAYCVGKAGVASLTLALAQELEDLGVRVNCISPSARTPMSQQKQAVAERMKKPDDPTALDRYDPREVAPLVACLALPTCTITGTVFRVQGGSIIRYNGWSRGAEITTDVPWTMDDLAGRLPALAAAMEGGDADVRRAMRANVRDNSALNGDYVIT